MYFLFEKRGFSSLLCLLIPEGIWIFEDCDSDGPEKNTIEIHLGIFLGSKFCWEGAVFIFQSAQEDIDIDSRNLRGAWCFQPGWKRHAGRIRNHLPKNIRGNKSKIRWARKLQMEWHTVDGTNPAPVDTVNIPLFTGFYTSQVVQDFFHQQ